MPHPAQPAASGPSSAQAKSQPTAQPAASGGQLSTGKGRTRAVSTGGPGPVSQQQEAARSSQADLPVAAPPTDPAVPPPARKPGPFAAVFYHSRPVQPQPPEPLQKPGSQKTTGQKRARASDPGASADKPTQAAGNAISKASKAPASSLSGKQTAAVQRQQGSSADLALPQKHAPSQPASQKQASTAPGTPGSRLNPGRQGSAAHSMDPISLSPPGGPGRPSRGAVGNFEEFPGESEALLQQQAVASPQGKAVSSPQSQHARQHTDAGPPQFRADRLPTEQGRSRLGMAAPAGQPGASLARQGTAQQQQQQTEAIRPSGTGTGTAPGPSKAPSPSGGVTALAAVHWKMGHVQT